jgi:glucose-1-phosphate thymidylyltransferase
MPAVESGMQAVVFAAGEGTRMRPLTAEQPKGLVDVAGQPMLARCFEALSEAAISECVVVIGYHAEQIVDTFGDAYAGLSLRYVKQREPDGLASALATAAPELDCPVLAVNGDNVFNVDIACLIERHRRVEPAVTYLVERVGQEAASKGAVLELADESVVGVVEKPANPSSCLVPRGVRVLSRAVIDASKQVERGPTGEYDLSRAVDRVIDAGGNVETVPLAGWCVNVNTPADRERAASRLRD